MGLALGCSADSEPIATLHLDLTNCGDTLGSAPLKSTCGHGWVGPFGDTDGTGAPATPIVAETNIDFSGPSPSVSQTRVLYSVEHPGPGQSALKFTPSVTQDYAFALDSSLPLSVLEPDGTPVEALLSQNIATQCSDIGAALPSPAGVALSEVSIYRLTAGVTYRVVLGTGSATSVNLLVDEPNDFLNTYYADSDADGHGDPREPLVSECTAPGGYVSDDGDCNDVDISINPAADEVVDGEDNNCDGFVDVAGNGDLEMVSVDVAVPVRRLLVGQSGTVVIDRRVQNAGRAVVDAELTGTATASGAGDIAPANTSVAVDNLGSFEQRTLAESYTVTCNELGTATFTVGAEIQPIPGAPTDPDPTNNTGETTFAVECIACVHATQSLVLRDRTHVTSSDVLGGDYFEMGSDTATATVVANVQVDGNAFLRSTARVEGDLTLSGEMGIQGPWEVTGTLLENTPVTIPPIISFEFPTGSTGLFVPENESTVLAPANYASGKLDFGATADLRAGTYNFTTLVLEADAKLYVDTTLGDVFINAESGLWFGDRVEVIPTGGGKVAFYTNATSEVRVGVDMELNASLSAPFSKVKVYSRTNIQGCTSANEIDYEPDVTQIADGIPAGLPGEAAPLAATCTDGIQNGDEAGVDCGGSCQSECPTCSDGIQNGDEAGVDCGGSCPNACASCSDGVQNGDEAGVDCGGSCPNACPTCSDGIQNSDETGVDCGGSCPNPCSTPVSVSATLPVTTDWGTGYCVEVRVSNTGSVATNSWSVDVNLQQSTIYTNWNANFSGSSGQVTVASTGANGAIQPGQTTQSIGFCANRTPGTNNLPTVVSATGT